jgi:hypothetical protein
MLSLDKLALATPLPMSPEDAPIEREFKPLDLYH